MGSIMNRKEKKNVSWLKYVHPDFLLKLIMDILFNVNFFWITCSVLLVAEIFVNLVVIWKIKYTEIDWLAYMSEVEGFLNGTYDYTKLEGGTGPLVYPAGFLYIYSLFYYISNYGENVRIAQYMFVGLYLLTLLLVFYIYHKTALVPPFVSFFMCCASYRIHSIYILRLFNDPVAMIFLYASIVCFVHDHWKIGSLLFSAGVSVKMNILLFAPGLLVLMLVRHGLLGSIKNLCICAILQIILALPFLQVNAAGYLARSFNIGRQFFFIWTVNWRFLPENIFQSRWFHLVLLIFHLSMLCIFFMKSWPQPSRGWLSLFEKNFIGRPLSAQEIVYVMFSSNIIGICFARSLHYQFYVWYFHTLHYLLWNINVSSVLRLLVIGLIEMSWNTYPSTNFSSVVLHLCHAFILAGLLSKHKHKSLNKNQ